MDHIHFAAWSLAQNCDLGKFEVATLMGEISTRNPALLIGGYNVDIVIVATYYTLKHEYGDPINRKQEQEMYDRISNTIGAMYAGLI